MRIAFLCKRHYTGKDVIVDRFGRLYEMPRFLAEQGHSVRAYCLDYYGADDGEWTHSFARGSIHWTSRSTRPRRIPALAGLPTKMLRELRELSPDVLIGASDIPNIALAAWLARKLRVPYVIDLYDNFESFGQARIPGFGLALSSAARKASQVITVSEPLAQLVASAYGAEGEVIVMPNGVDTRVFRRRDKASARDELELPQGAKLVGTAGGLSRKKGVDVLYSAWSRIEEVDDAIHLVLAGPLSRDLPLLRGERVHYLGNLSHAKVARLFNALDVGIVTLSDDAFGRFCFPQKAYEMLACELPIVATDVGVMSSLLAESPDLLHPAGDADALARSILGQIDRPIATLIPVKGWDSLLARMETALAMIVANPCRPLHRDDISRSG